MPFICRNVKYPHEDTREHANEQEARRTIRAQGSRPIPARSCREPVDLRVARFVLVLADNTFPKPGGDPVDRLLRRTAAFTPNATRGSRDFVCRAMGTASRRQQSGAARVVPACHFDAHALRNRHRNYPS